jgi:Icc-related predicted phosphoesterase
MMRVYAISDFHGSLPPSIPECELLLLGGDYCLTRDVGPQKKFLTGKFTKFLETVPARYIVAVAGNHDFALQNTEFAKSLPWIYLQDEQVEIEGIKIYGTPWTPPFYDWAFMAPEAELKDKFYYIPEGLDILLSHGPAYRHLDRAMDGYYCGSLALQAQINQVKPDSVVCGHIHEAHGIMQEGDTRYYNVAYMNHKYIPTHEAVSISLKAK